MVDTFLHFADELLLFYISFSSIYLLIFAVAAQFRRSDKYPPSGKLNRYAILVPENTPALAIDYPKESYCIINCQNLAETVHSLSEEEFDAVVVLGETSEISAGFLREINHAYDSGIKVIQLHHIITPRSSIGRKLMAIQEEIKNSLFKQGHTGVGFSSALNGMDMVLDLKWLKKNLKSSKTNLEVRLSKQNTFIEYLEYVTVSSSSPRKKRYVLPHTKALTRFPSVLISGNWNYASKLLQRFIPSWFTLLLLSMLMAGIFTYMDWTLSVKWWVMIFFLFFIMALAIPDYLVEKKKKAKKNGK